MSTRTQALRVSGPVADRVAERNGSEWRLVLAGLAALLLLLTTLIVLATVNAPSTGGADHGSRNVTSRDTGVVRVGGDGPFKFHPLP